MPALGGDLLCTCRHVMRLSWLLVLRVLWAPHKSHPPLKFAGWCTAWPCGVPGPWLVSSACSAPTASADGVPLSHHCRLVHSEALQRACPIPFDEGRMWKGDHSEALRAELQVN